MIAIAFIPNPENKPDINHIDGNKVNNAISNLEWITESENQLLAIKLGLRKNFKNGYTDPTIYHLLNKKTNKYFKGLISEFRKTHEIKAVLFTK